MPESPFRAAVAEKAREFYWSRSWAQTTYSQAARWRAAAEERFGRWDAAMVGRCNAARRLSPGAGKAALRQRQLEQLRRLLERAHGGRMPATPAENRFVAAFLGSARAAAQRRRMQGWERKKQRTLGDNLIVLKAPRPQERGVVLVKFSGWFEPCLVAFQLRLLFERFSVVLEPSWTLAPETSWGLFAATECPPVIQTITNEVADLMSASRLPLIPVRMGPHDWVDGDTFRPLGLEKEFDVVMVAAFTRIKRHYQLFDTMRQLRPRRRLKVALVGFTWQRTQQQLEAEMDQYGVRGDVTLFRDIEPEQVNQVLNRSRAAVLLSRREGGNKSQMEALAAGVPLVLYRHIIGPVDHLNAETGRFADDSELGAVLLEVLDHPERFQPRAWFERNSGYLASTASLNAVLRQQAERRGERWTADIAAKCNRPGLCYARAGLARELEPAWNELESLLAL